MGINIYRVIDESVNGYVGSQNFHELEYFSQTFTAGSSYSLAGVRVRLSISSPVPGTLTAQLFATTLGEPSGASLATGSIGGGTVPSVPDLAEFIFDTAYDVVSGTQYAIVLDNRDGFGANPVWALYNLTNIYSGGTFWTSNDAGATWSDESPYDLDFQTLVLVGTAHTIGEKELKTEWDARSAADSTKAVGHDEALIPQESLVPDRKRVGLD